MHWAKADKRRDNFQTSRITTERQSQTLQLIGEERDYPLTNLPWFLILILSVVVQRKFPKEKHTEENVFKNKCKIYFVCWI